MRVCLLAFISALFAACIIAPVVGQNGNTYANDVNTLNYALALERLESAYYQCYLYPLNNTNSDCTGRGYNAFSQTDFANAGYNASVWNAVNVIAAQEFAHVALLNSVVAALGGSPVPRCIYNFAAIQPAGVSTVAQFLSLSRTLENVGVSAYAGAVNAITNTAYEQVAVTIATVEARHAAWLDQLLGNQPFNSSGFDIYRTPTEIAALVGPALGSANCVSTLPTVRPYGVASATPTTFAWTGPIAQSSNVSYSATQRANDIKLLNYALTLEQLEAAFYNAAAATFNQAAFTAAGLSSTVYNNFVVIGLNENTHVAALRAIIPSYGGVAVANCTYNFTGALSSFQNYLNTAQLLENTGVSAYAGAANTITDTNLQRTAATIAMIEARHAAYINVINSNPTNNTAAFPTYLDTATTPSDIFAAVLGTGLITACPFTPDLPVVLPQSVGIPSSTGAFTPTFSSSSSGTVTPARSSSSGGNGASSTASFSMAMIVVAIIASLALV